MDTTSLKAIEEKKCYHCGDDCKDQSISLDSKFFCCQGCKAVYEILNTGNACEYYQLQENPGVKSNQPSQDLSFLDDDGIRQKLLSFYDGTISRVTFYIPSVHCSSCIWLLENLSRLHAGIIHSRINFIRKEVTVTFKEQEVSLREVAELLGKVGYMPLINLEHADGSKKKIDRSLYYKIGVAGFSFGNIMMLALPEYLDGQAVMEDSLKKYFSYLSLLLAVPAFVYGGSDYLVNSWRGLKKRILNIEIPIALSMFALFFKSVYEILSHTGAGYLDSLSGLVFFLLVGKWFQARTYEALSFDRDFRSYFPVAVKGIRDGKEVNIAVTDLKSGDHIRIRSNELIPSDAVIRSGKGSIDYSFVTGESRPVTKYEGDKVFAGGRQKGAILELEVLKEVSASQITELWNDEAFAKPSVSKISGITDKVSYYFTPAVLLTGVAVYLFWTLTDPSLAMHALASVFIVACPCIFALAIPFAFGNSMNTLGNRGFYLRKPDLLANLAKADTIVFDKTGTLTRTDVSEVTYEGKPLSEEELAMVYSLTEQSTHPLSEALYSHLQDRKSYVISEFREEASEGITGKCNKHIVVLGSAKFAGAKDVSDCIRKSSQVHVSIDGDYKGVFLIKNKYRKGFDEMIVSLEKDYNLHLLSGDNESEKPYLQTLFRDPDNLHFDMKPADKLNYIKALKKKGHTVMMIGDGLNDAGALKAADFGISISDNVYNFSPACDAILDSRKLSRLHRYVRYARQCLTIVWIAFVLSLVYNFTGLGFAVQGILSPLIAAILMPSSAILIVCYVTWATSLKGRKL
ncbi:heavy metal translocating P-type ATPase metal-binding domain-containing protein [Cytophagaceae bacterium ABcell3]|nr:heavy metal translocating P-type ATPase metal-binding domain-containing protein [Cytophagaceae bacterium ABcell3]